MPASALVIIPPSDVCDAIDPWRRRYDPYGVHMPPHITLAYPPFVPPGYWPVLCLELAELLQEIHPFEITLDGVGSFSGIPQSLWLRAVDDGALSRLRGLLESSFPEYIQPLSYEFTPHLTVGQFEEDGPLAAARAELESGWRALRFEVDRLYYAGQSDEGRWQVRDSVSLARSG